MTAASIRHPELRLVHSTDPRSAILPHLDAAYNLARWLLKNDHDAADAVQDACVKALRNVATYRGGDEKSWLLAIVRTTAIDRLRASNPMARTPAAAPLPADPPAASSTPLSDLLRAADRALIASTLSDLPDTHREIIILREIEGLTYTQIATVLSAPVGTVMSRLSRARDALAAALRERFVKE